MKEVKQRLQRTRDPTERLAIFRKAYRIKVKGDDVPAPLERFEDLEAKHGCVPVYGSAHLLWLLLLPPLLMALTLAPRSVPPTVLSNLASLGFHDPTPIQRQATTCLLAGRELLAVAPTGSGKTLAFLVPMLSGIARAKTHSKERMHVRGVVLSPTRELGGQTATVARLLAKGTGVSPALASKALETSGRKAGTVDVLVGTPARLAAMSREGEDLSRCMYLVLDEADKLFEVRSACL